MKKKRIILHICILLLAAMCIGNGIFFLNNAGRLNSKDKYTMQYYHDMHNAINIAYASYQFRSFFDNPGAVLAQNDSEGTVTASDVIEMVNHIRDGKDHYYIEGSNNSTYTNLASFYYTKSKQYNKLLNNTTDSNTDKITLKEKLDYYQLVCNYIEMYTSITDTLPIEPNFALLDNEDKERALNNSIYYLTSDEDSNFRFSIKYIVNDAAYTISNADEAQLLNSDNYSDVYMLDGLNIKAIRPEIVDLNDRNYGLLLGDELPLDSEDFISSKITGGVFGIDKNFPVRDSYYTEYNLLKNTVTEDDYVHLVSILWGMFIASIIEIFIAFILFIILLIDAGHKEKNDTPALNRFDKLYFDVVACCAFIVYISIYYILYGMSLYYFNDTTEILHDKVWILFQTILIIMLMIGVEFTVLLSESFVRRIKCKSLIKTTLIGRILIWIKKKLLAILNRCKKMIQNILSNTKLSVKIIASGALAAFWAGIVIIFALTSYRPFLPFILACIPIAILCYIIWHFFIELKIIKDGADKISSGEIDYKIKDTMKYPSNKELKDSINNIGDGLNNAIAKSIKNERMKTELITNVSHDIKTPLTSIINYVDLLKKEGTDCDKAPEYVDILERKAARLKNLTEDLIEASKLNSGVADICKEKIDVIQLLKQSLGEYSEKFAEKKLEVISSVFEEHIYVNADGRKIWRVFENLYNNIYKYAMPGTRVYIDTETFGETVTISIKNISDEPLNCDSSELTERFIRGDASRSTEGSGLGLSIARSIIEIHDGVLTVTLDGDLFKVQIDLPMLSA